MRKKILSIVLTALFLLAMGSPAMAAREHLGRPSKHEAANSMGYYVWQEGTRWHIRTVNAGTPRLFTGMIETDGAFAEVTTLPSEKVERVAVNVRSEKIEFHFNSEAKTDGFSFTASRGDKLTFTFYVDGLPADPANIYFGSANRNPGSSSFSVRLRDDVTSGDPYNKPRPSEGTSPFEGQPTAFNPGNILGYFIWLKNDRWHVKMTTRGAERRFSGSVRTNGTFADMNWNNLDATDRISVNSPANEIKFDLKTTRQSEGFSFRTNKLDDITFLLYMDGKPVDPNNIFLGADNRQPGTSSFTIINRNSITNHPVNYSQPVNPNTVNRIDSSRFQGQPTALNPGNEFGYFIWQSQNRWHLQTTTTGPERQFKGVIETDGTFSEVQKLRSMRSDGAVVDVTGKKINFTFNTGGSSGGITLSLSDGLRLNQPDRVSGLSFLTSDGAKMKFTLLVDGEANNPANIHIGRANWHPSTHVIHTTAKN